MSADGVSDHRRGRDVPAQRADESPPAEGASGHEDARSPLETTPVQTVLTEALGLASVQISTVQALAAALGKAQLPLPPPQQAEMLAALTELSSRYRRCLEQTQHCQNVLEQATT